MSSICIHVPPLWHPHPIDCAKPPATPGRALSEKDPRALTSTAGVWCSPVAGCGAHPCFCMHIFLFLHAAHLNSSASTACTALSGNCCSFF